MAGKNGDIGKTNNDDEQNSGDDIEEIIFEDSREYSPEEIRKIMENLAKVKQRLKENKLLTKQKLFETISLNEKRETELQNRIRGEEQKRLEYQQQAMMEQQFRIQLEQELGQLESTPVRSRQTQARPTFDLNEAIHE